MKRNYKGCSFSVNNSNLFQNSSSFNFSLSTIPSKTKIDKHFSPRIYLKKDNFQLNNFHKITLHSRLIKSLDQGKFPTEIDMNKYKLEDNLNLPTRLNMEIGTLFPKYRNNDIYFFKNTTSNIARIKKLIRMKETFIKIKDEKIKNTKIKLKDSLGKAKGRYKKFADNIIPKYDNYLNFLYKRLDEEIEKLHSLRIRKNELIMETHKIQSLINDLKAKKEIYIKLRNFLICVREKITKLPKTFIESSYQYDYNLDFEIKNERNSIFGIRNPFKKSGIYPNMAIRKTISTGSLQSIYKTKYFKYLNKSYSIFKSPEEFRDNYKEMEFKNLKYVFKLNEINSEIQDLKKELKQIKEEEKRYDNLFIDDLNKKKYILLENKSKNEGLMKKLYLMQNNQYYNESNSKKIEVNSHINQNLTELKVEKIKNKISFKNEESYIFYFLFILVQNIYNTSPELFKNLDKMKYLERINILSNPENFKEDDVRKIAKEVLHDLENIITYLLTEIKINKNKIDKKIVNDIKKKIQNLRRIQNGKEQRELLHEKKIDKVKIYIENKNKYQYRIKKRFVDMFDLNKNKVINHKKILSDVNSDINEIFFSE
jgi:hypothetical protein